MNTVLITGASSGIGRETAKLFRQTGWNVLATMRDPDAEEELAKFENVKLLRCDVTDQDSIRTAVKEGIACFGKIDVLVNNAGYYLLGPLEAASHEQIKRQIDTNLLGMIDVTKEMVPHFRKQKSGTIISVVYRGCCFYPVAIAVSCDQMGRRGFF